MSNMQLEENPQNLVQAVDSLARALSQEIQANGDSDFYDSAAVISIIKVRLQTFLREQFDIWHVQDKKGNN